MSETEKVEALAELAGTVAHELNNIFTAVTGNLSLLEGSLPRGGEHARVVSDVMRTAFRGIALSETLQAFAGRQRLHLADFDLNPLVAATLYGLKRTVLRGIKLKLALHRSSCPVRADAEKLGRALEELARNAAIAMDSQGTLTITTERVTLAKHDVARLAAGPYVRLAMMDSGPGMQPDVLKRAMEPNFSTRAGRGGWGLAKCAGLIRQLAGEMRLSSASGQGSLVEIFLPQGR